MTENYGFRNTHWDIINFKFKQINYFLNFWIKFFVSYHRLIFSSNRVIPKFFSKGSRSLLPRLIFEISWSQIVYSKNLIDLCTRIKIRAGIPWAFRIDSRVSGTRFSDSSWSIWTIPWAISKIWQSNFDFFGFLSNGALRIYPRASGPRFSFSPWSNRHFPLKENPKI